MPEQPNILFIMSDDHAANAISCYGSRLAKIASTPHMDRIASEGARVDACFCTNAICTPSRAVIMTGQHSHINGVRTLADVLDPERPNVAKMLQGAGYQTAIVGKWHLKSEPSGFDYYNCLPGQGLYFDPILSESGKEWINEGRGGDVHQGYVTDIVTDLSLDWLRARDDDKPFFLMCHHKAPHGKWEFDEKHAHLFEDVEAPEPGSLWEDKSHRSSGSRDHGNGMKQLSARMDSSGEAPGFVWPTGRLDTDGMSDREKKAATYQKYVKDYLRCVASIDDNVGRLLSYLDDAGLAEDTIVIYTSDQGQFLGEHNYYDKRWIFEESLQMPFLVRYPREIAAGTAPTGLLQNLDFAPTFLDYAGAETPDDMQGRSFRSVLTGNRPDDWRTSVYYRYWMHMSSHLSPGHYGVRTNRYKLIFFYGLPLDANKARPEPTEPGMELYDLEKDPKELNNVYDDPAYADVVKELKAELLRLKEECGDTDEKYPELMERREVFFGK